VRALIAGYEPAQAIYVAARLDLATLLEGDPRTAAELARATGADEDALLRLLRALAGLDVLAQVGDRRFALGPLGRALHPSAPGSARAAALLAGERSYRAWGGLLHAVRTGETAFRHVFGMGTFEYMERHPEVAAIYNDAMTAASAARAAAVVKSHDFGSVRRLVDVGGGHGTLLAAILAACPAASGILLDRPSVVPGATAHLAAAGVAARCVVEAGDFFAAVPAGGDAYLLSHILHNWDDQACVTVLGHCRAAMAPGGRVLVLETVLPERIEPGAGGRRATMADLHMLVITGGRERTTAEYAALLGAAGFDRVSTHPLDGGESLLEARPA
jgi:hypothetical protein